MLAWQVSPAECVLTKPAQTLGVPLPDPSTKPDLQLVALLHHESVAVYRTAKADEHLKTQTHT